MVPPASHKIARVSWYSGSRPAISHRPVRDSHPLWSDVPVGSSNKRWLGVGPTTPALLTKHWFGLRPFRSPLLWASRLISLRRATEMFQFAHCPPTCLCVRQAVSRHHSGGVAPFGLSGLMACMQLPRNVSPVSASFIGLQRQGIHPVLCRACRLDSGLSLLSWRTPGEVDWRHDVFVRSPLLRFCWRLLGKIEVILIVLFRYILRCPNT